MPREFAKSLVLPAGMYPIGTFTSLCSMPDVYKRQLLDSVKSLKAESLPVCRIFSVDVSDSCCKHIYTKISNSLALVWIDVYKRQVIDSGVPVLNMHAPWEIISKVDLYEAFRGYIAFLKEA